MRHSFMMGSRLLYPAYVQDYLDRVIAADVTAGVSSGLERGVTDAASTFLQDLVSDSYLGVSGSVISEAASVIKAMPIMAGARTRQGALVPVVGTTPTEFGTVGGWNYNRETGLQGNGTDNYLNANRLSNAEPQNSYSMSLFSSNGISNVCIGSESGSGVLGETIAIGSGSTDLRFKSRFTSGVEINFGNRTAAGFYGHSRSTAAGFTARSGNLNTPITITSSAPVANPTFIYRRPNPASPFYSLSRLSFYHIGQSLNLVLLDARVTTLMAAYAAAI